jgi:hypothetical protein
VVKVSTGFLLVLSLAFGCGGQRADSTTRPQSQPLAVTAKCQPYARAANPLPGIEPRELEPEYWLERYSADALDAVLMDEADIEAYNRRVGKRQGRQPYSQRDLRVPFDALELQESLDERLAQLRSAVTSGHLIARDGHPVPEADALAFEQPVTLQNSSLRLLLAPALLRCGPFSEGLYRPIRDAAPGTSARSPSQPSTGPNSDGAAVKINRVQGAARIEPAYDRNACGALKAQEPVELLGKTASGMWLIRSRYSLGFLPADASFSPPIGRATHVAALEGAPPKPLTRRALLNAAFATLDRPYGLGNAEGGLDCSSLLFDLFEGFGIALPHFSGWQAQGGVYRVSTKNLPDGEKLRVIDIAAESGIVVLHFPGHTMLYLGRSAQGEPRVLHALGDFLVPCGAGETEVEVQRVVVSGLELGKRTTRTSLLERITSFSVFGKAVPPALQAVSDAGPSEPPGALRRAPPCRDTIEHRIFISPANPQPFKPLRAIAVSARAPGGASLRIFDGNGETMPVDVFPLGGPPYAAVARFAFARAGVYTAVLGSGPNRLACRRFVVRKSIPEVPNPEVPDKLVPPLIADATSPPPVEAPVWIPTANWQPDTEALFAAFVEQLFTGPPDDEQTWSNLHSLLRHPSRNLLYDHLGLGEEKQIEIKPDCADLPYSLRAYFAWKLRLPFAFRRCLRERSGRPPSCGPLISSTAPMAKPQSGNEVETFANFVNLVMRPGVNSSTGRTVPGDSNTDLYPVALEREALAPGTVYADPYGHILIVSKWFKQGSLGNSNYGVLLASEAQPDGTIGRRRFWEGSFLFDPDTTTVGAGFKRFRPLIYHDRSCELRALTNDELTRAPQYIKFSLEQYQQSRESFYDRVEALINPVALPPHDRLTNLLDALEEAARRRVLSVDNGETYARKNPGKVIEMPQGYEIFETAGAWEDFATPSRDMRLLIAIDTVLALPKRVEQRPERFALPPDTSPTTVAARLRKVLAGELQSRFIQYTRSNGSLQKLTLADLVARVHSLEIAYNPNDCVEVRWGASKGSSEYATCNRFAPPEQQALMLSYRTWFRKRTRPPREWGNAEPCNARMCAEKSTQKPDQRRD